MRQVELLTELASIAKRLAADEWGLAAMESAGMHTVLTSLLASSGTSLHSAVASPIWA
jgi:hypothetical protein